MFNRSLIMSITLLHKMSLNNLLEKVKLSIMLKENVNATLHYPQDIDFKEKGEKGGHNRKIILCIINLKSRTMLSISVYISSQE